MHFNSCIIHCHFICLVLRFWLTVICLFSTLTFEVANREFWLRLPPLSSEHVISSDERMCAVECCFGCSCLPRDELLTFFFSLCWCVWMFLHRGLINIWSAKESPAQTWGCLKVSCTWSGSTSTTGRETQGEVSLNVCAEWKQGFTVCAWWISTL